MSTKSKHVNTVEGLRFGLEGRPPDLDAPNSVNVKVVGRGYSYYIVDGVKTNIKRKKMKTKEDNQEDIMCLRFELAGLENEVQEYLDKPNKTKSRKLRVALNELKGSITGIKKALMALDKEGY